VKIIEIKTLELLNQIRIDKILWFLEELILEMKGIEMKLIRGKQIVKGEKTAPWLQGQQHILMIRDRIKIQRKLVDKLMMMKINLERTLKEEKKDNSKKIPKLQKI
jgi:hypothetical protein